jgi:hypothetical protein
MELISLQTLEASVIRALLDNCTVLRLSDYRVQAYQRPQFSLAHIVVYILPISHHSQEIIVFRTKIRIFAF